MSDKVTVIKVPAPKTMHSGGDLTLMKNFVDLIEGKTKTSVAPLVEGIKSAKVCLRAKESAETEEFKTIE